jgi:hypothetical protein
MMKQYEGGAYGGMAYRELSRKHNKNMHINAFQKFESKYDLCVVGKK